ncbi:MAG: glycosyltransferase [Turicibacter sp.]|nr:glycosyltransferase [Turicibacter sp.]
MNILIISWGELEFDGRLRELVKSFSQLGEVFLFSGDRKPMIKHHTCLDKSNYWKYVLAANKYGKHLKNIDVVVIDNRKAIIPARIIKRRLKIKQMILDCRETYFLEDVKHFSGKIGCLIEKPAILKADIVIAANLERAQIMQKRYQLKQMPVVFENIRELEYSEKFNEQVIRKKYENILNTDAHIILASSGCSFDRDTDVLVDDFAKVKHKCRLLLAGWNYKADEQAIRRIIEKNKSDNIFILGRVSQDELKYLTQNCEVGIVNYCQKDINYKYCASGKIFEFLFEGIPVVTTTNPPLARMCKEGQIGIADGKFADAIDDILDNLEYYRDNVKRYAERKSVENNNKKLIEEIHKRLS